MTWPAVIGHMMIDYRLLPAAQLLSTMRVRNVAGEMMVHMCRADRLVFTACAGATGGRATREYAERYHRPEKRQSEVARSRKHDYVSWTALNVLPTFRNVDEELPVVRTRSIIGSSRKSVQDSTCFNDPRRMPNPLTFATQL